MISSSNGLRCEDLDAFLEVPVNDEDEDEAAKGLFRFTSFCRFMAINSAHNKEKPSKFK